MDERQIGGMKGWMEGRGRLPKGLIKRRQNEGNEKKEKKGGHCLSSFFLSKASVTAAEACLLLLPFS